MHALTNIKAHPHPLELYLLFVYVFFTVRLRCLSKRSANQDAQKWLDFLHCAFLNMPSYGLPEEMHNHTDYTCLTFLLCVF